MSNCNVMGQELGMCTNQIRLTWNSYEKQPRIWKWSSLQATSHIMMFPKKIKCVTRAGNRIYIKILLVSEWFLCYFHGGNLHLEAIAQGNRNFTLQWALPQTLCDPQQVAELLQDLILLPMIRANASRCSVMLIPVSRTQHTTPTLRKAALVF